ncbi:hypothetical protein BDN70DRAFT_430582 [Pholiota conissans]|uniref:RRM domain-containing protein n=1 Tax=Pholiota conissans TaxID=109636 RepID=A0A9P5Z7E5_9AGAR|nr:hypothetical protein BDN70DRAFT_430582 [Pholiota conissans]
MPSRTSKRLYFRGISKDITEDHLFKYLSRYGQISEVKMLSNYAFVQFESEKEALLVLETYKDQPLLGCRVVVEFAHPLRKDVTSFSSNSSTQSRPAHRVVYARHPVVVLGLPKDIRWQELKDFGRSSGMLVAFCDLDKIQEGRGFIEFFSREDARLAVTTLNGHTRFRTRFP